MKVVDLLENFSARLNAERETAAAKGLDAPIVVTSGRLLATSGTLHLYQFETPTESPILEDSPITVLPTGNLEPTEGFVVSRRGRDLWVQTFDAFGQRVDSCTLVPDTAGFLEVASRRLNEMAKSPERFSLAPAERLVPWFDPEQPPGSEVSRGSVPTLILTTSWAEDLATRRGKLASMAIEAVRANKRLLLISPDHHASDGVVGVIARAMRGGGLHFKSLVSRYEMPLSQEASGMALEELGFEAQMHQFYAKSRNEKANLRKKYDRFRELTPVMAYKAEKQRDLDEVKLLEWRLLTQLSEHQGKIKEIDQTLVEYETLPIWKRLAMQTAGKNIDSLGEYRIIYQKQAKLAIAELDVAKARIEELRAEATIPRDLRPEYEELKEEIARLGGTKKIRELLAAEEGTNRQAFLQNKRLVATTGARVISDPLFTRVRFDMLLVDEAPHIPAPYILAAAGLVRDRIVLSGNHGDIPDARQWAWIEGRAAGQPAIG